MSRHSSAPRRLTSTWSRSTPGATATDACPAPCTPSSWPARESSLRVLEHRGKLGTDDFNTREYYAALRSVQAGSWQPQRDAHSWIRFCLTAHHLQAQEVQRRFETAARLRLRLEAITRRHGLDEPTVSVLHAATNGTLRSTTYQAEEALTHDQALGNLRTLRRLDLVQAVGHARTQHYLAGPEVRRAHIEIHDEVHADLYREPYRN